jgi:RNA polymerase sigma factor (sigma-70 family)
MNDDRELIARFAATRDAQAFAELVRRHVDWIYAAARRHVGEANAADVTQAVFVVLAEKSATAARQPALSPWLFGVLRFAGLRCRRGEARRRHHERAAAEQGQRAMDDSNPAEREQMLAMLDELVAKLRERDRRPVVMRYYQRCSFAEIGRALGVSEEAARKRVTRSVDRLRSMFAARGVSGAPGDAIGMFALTQLVYAAPPAVAVHAAQAAVSTGTAVGASGVLAKGAMAMMRIQQLQRAAMVLLAVTTVAAVGGAATHVLGNGGPPPPVAAGASNAQRQLFGAAAAAPSPQVETIQSQDTLLAISRDGTRISGYSKRQGKWTPLTLDNAAQTRLKGGGAKLSPIVGEGVGALRLGTKVYAYSPQTGTWDQVDVADKPQADPVVYRDQVIVNYDDRLHAFSAMTGKWATVDFGQ